mgnify:CR=1 FL=1
MSGSINEIISFQAESATHSSCGTESGLISIDQALALPKQVNAAVQFA